MKLDDIKDPKLKERVVQALEASESFIADLRRSIPGPPSDATLAIKTPKKPRRRIRQDTKPLMNKLEQEYFYKVNKDHPNWTIRPQAIRFRLGNGIWFRPDFTAMDTHPIEIKPVAWEVKGPHSFRGGFENLKVAANQYPDWYWVLVWKEDGIWKEQNILS